MINGEILEKDNGELFSQMQNGLFYPPEQQATASQPQVKQHQDQDDKGQSNDEDDQQGDNQKNDDLTDKEDDKENNEDDAEDVTMHIRCGVQEDNDKFYQDDTQYRDCMTATQFVAELSGPEAVLERERKHRFRRHQLTVVMFAKHICIMFTYSFVKYAF